MEQPATIPRQNAASQARLKLKGSESLLHKCALQLYNSAWTGWRVPTSLLWVLWRAEGQIKRLQNH